ncbi:MAG: glycoside hydrolase family 5 protein [Pseudomonadota bacterium]
MTGVNLAGLEFNPSKIPGLLNTDFPAPDPIEISYYRGVGARILRLPFLWERMQPTLNGSLDAAYAGLIDTVIAQAQSLGLTILLDAHQYGRRMVEGQSYIIGETATVTAAHFAQFWSAMAQRYHGKPVIYGLTNEPHDQDIDNLAGFQNDAITAIRSAGATERILVSGTAWTGAHSWVSSGNGVAMLAIRDSGANYAFDVHQYLDADSSGGSAVCTAGAGGRLAAFTDWARLNGKKGFLGEFAGGANADCTSELTTLLRSMRDASDVWIGWSCWAGGAWWPDTYQFILKPASLTTPVDRPQMTVLRQFFQ